jgi:hypothetical protein
MRKFRKKPVVIEAVQFEAGNQEEIAKFMGGVISVVIDQEGEVAEILIKTLEGDMWAVPGDWIIKGVKGEFYPCKPDIFAATYEEVSSHEEVS